MIDLVKTLIEVGKKVVAENPHKNLVLEQINTKDEHSIEMDVLLEKTFIEKINESKIPMNIYSEEIGVVANYENPKYFISFDPLDGSTNYKIGKNTLPYGTLISIYEMPNPTMSEIVACGAIEYTSGDYWLYDGKETTDKDGSRVLINNTFEISVSTPIYIDLHFRQGFQNYEKVSKSLFIRNEGSTIGNLRHLLNGVSGALAMSKMKAEEVGSVVGLIKGAGGVVVDHQGHSLLTQNFNNVIAYQVIGGSENIVNCIQENLNKN